MTKNKFLTLLLSVGIAFGLWAYVITAVTPEVEQTFHGIPVTLLNENVMRQQRNLCLTKDDYEITLTLRGNRADLNKLKASDIKVTVDLARVLDVDPAPLNPDIVYTGFSNDKFTEVSREPSSIQLEVDYLKTKPIAVEAEWLNEEDLEPGYRVYTDEVLLSHKELTISGPASVINEIDKAVVNVDLKDRNSSFSEDIRPTLCNAAGEGVDARLVEVLDVTQVNVTLLVYREVELPLSVTAIPGGGATRETAAIDILPQRIKIAATNSVLENMGDSLDLGQIDLGQIQDGLQQEMEIKLPEGVKLISPETTATVSVSFPELAKKEFSIPAGNFIIEPALAVGLMAEFEPSALVVTVRGPKALIDTMQETDITVSLDLSQAQAGTLNVAPTITLSEAFAQAGVLGNEYTVTVHLKTVENP